MAKIKYITTLDLENIRGGWSSLNNKVFVGLSNNLDMDYIKIGDIPIGKFDAFVSRLSRFFGFRGKYFYYSKKRLNKFKNSVNKQIGNNDILIFFGSTPWIEMNIENTYYVISDISFKGYYSNYNKDLFIKKDVSRITEQEERFLKKAQYIFLTSKWASNEMSKDYKIDSKKIKNVGIAGNISGKFSAGTIEKLSILFIANNFISKGGELLFDSFQKLLQEFPKLELDIVGSVPQKNVIEHINVNYHGYLNKSIKGDLDKYCDLLKNATFHLLPTKSDAAPLTIIECGYFGTPSIAPNKFAISELISDGVSGYLLPEEFDLDAIVQTASIYLRMTNQEKLNIRESTFAFYKSKSWDSVINNVISNLK